VLKKYTQIHRVCGISFVPAYVWTQPKKTKNKAYLSNEIVRMGAFNIASWGLCNEIVANEIVWIGGALNYYFDELWYQTST
jgi:hypothetical protein